MESPEKLGTQCTQHSVGHYYTHTNNVNDTRALLQTKMNQMMNGINNHLVNLYKWHKTMKPQYSNDCHDFYSCKTTLKKYKMHHSIII